MPPRTGGNGLENCRLCRLRATRSALFTMGWASRVLLVTLLLVALADAQSKSGSEPAAEPSSGGKSSGSGTNPALHVINERILLSAAYAYEDDNEVVCIFCLLQLLAAAHTMGNDLVRREIETSLQSREPGRLGEALLQLVSGAPTLSGTFAGLYQKDALPKCELQPAWRRSERCYAIERFINLRGTKVDFTQPGTTSLINSLIDNASGNMIQQMFPPLPTSSQLVFASVLVFRDTWRQRLYWQPGSFTTFYGNLSAETLIQQDYLPLLDGSSDGVIGVSLPYSMPGMRMMLFTTSDGGSVVERLRTVHYRALAGAPLTYTTVFFPRFSVWSNKYSYADMAQQMGISEMFRGGLGLGDRLRMELFVQRAIVSADVDGTDSLTPAPEAVWDGGHHPTPVQVVFDRPFVCSLVHSELDVPFFTAVIRDPTRFY
ncbi:Serine protease inhibitor [Amphibalanus amphitrite]|uniref:Serine protease inhibitor n=1 Tax=Amphibalanus amphitrite TaxID=1232801 RepID=A0A6A4WAC5_AMPAM|nr:Serine protease inhibitor [Amphibalanus amphitrite]